MTFKHLDLEKDYPILKKIWEKSPMKVAPPTTVLAQDGIAFWDGNDELKGAIFTYYIYNSSMALIGFPLLDDSVKDDRDIIMNHMYKLGEDLCKSLGYEIISTWSSLPHVKERLENNGWTAGDDGLVNYLKKL